VLKEAQDVEDARAAEKMGRTRTHIVQELLNSERVYVGEPSDQRTPADLSEYSMLYSVFHLHG
jgi:hypothetical protein